MESIGDLTGKQNRHRRLAAAHHFVAQQYVADGVTEAFEHGKFCVKNLVVAGARLFGGTAANHFVEGAGIGAVRGFIADEVLSYG
jgi:hypothetical protein